MKYGSIPQEDVGEGVSQKRSSCCNKTTLIYVILAVAVLGGLFHLKRRANLNSKKAPPDNGQWPGLLMKYGGEEGIVSKGPTPLFPPFAFNYYPTTTTEATDAGWIKSQLDGESCNPLLGEAWRVGGELSLECSVTLHFTPQVGETPGVVSGITVSYFNYIEEALVGTYFSEVKTNSDGSTYHDLTIALRNGGEENLCDASSSVAPGNPAYVVIAPGMANNVLPVREDDPELQENWFEGACLDLMGYHWFQDVVGGSDFSYREENFVPIVPMYSSHDGLLNGIFFVSHTQEQFENSHSEYSLTPWDAGVPGLLAENPPHFFPPVPPKFCVNMCGETCGFEGGDPQSKFISTMHFFFRDTLLGSPYAETSCGPISTCRNGLVPVAPPPMAKIIGVGIAIVALLIFVCKRFCSGCC